MKTQLLPIVNFVFIDKKTPNASRERWKVIKNWFKDLSIYEKSVVLTTIDKDLAQMIRAMYKT